ncbi:MAG TPA: histidine kinase N-terminal 7TM domain-containing protein [Draconibacterium sp.]|nr:histidine kinase N-terminal 7TM domain-containing protein [Draconibacterium sp.]
MLEFIPLGSIIQFLTAIAAIALVGVLWKNRKASEVLFLILIELNAAIWAFFYASEFSTPVLQSKIIWSQLSYLGIAFLPVNYFFFTLALSQTNRFINIKSYLLASIIPLVTIIMVISNPSHHLVWENISLPPGSNIMYYVHGPWFWTFWGYAFVLIILGVINLIRLYFKVGRTRRLQVALVFLASMFPIFGNISYVTGINPYVGFDWTTTGFAIAGIIFTIGIYRHRMFEIMPLATQKLIRTLKDGIIIINDQGLIEDINPATRQIFSLNGHPVIKESYREVFKNYRDVVNAIEKEEEENSFDFELKHEDDIHYFILKTLPIVNENKRFSGKLVMISDITTIRKSEIQLMNRNQLLIKEIERNENLIADLDSFAHTVAHELKNLLGAIYTSSDAVLDSLEDQEYDIVKELSVMVRESAIKTIKVTDELMKLATAGNQEVEKETVDMQRIFEQARDQLKDQIAESGAIIMVADKLKTIKSYGPWLIEVWINFLGNAIKYGGTPPEIKVGNTEMNDGKIKFWVHDNGDGIAPEHQASLFQKHTRFHRQKALGYGLGLSIVKQITEKLDGTVGVESTGQPGEGATFYFVLPCK